MARTHKPRKTSASVTTRLMQPNAAGVDVGATEIYVAVPPDRDPQPVRCFRTFTDDLQVAADWLGACGIQSIAMESTGVYWIPFFQILEARGFEVFLVNARHVKNVPGRKTDVSDCQWLQYLHSVGLLRASFRPQQDVCAIRSILRHRETLVQIATVHIQHIQKASEETVAAALVGDYRREHLFTMRQSLTAYRHYQRLIGECDFEIEQQLKAFDSKINIEEEPLGSPKDHHKPRRNELRFDLRSHLYRVFGVDLTQVPGINSLTAHVLFAEIGPDLSRFHSASAFAS